MINGSGRQNREDHQAEQEKKKKSKFKNGDHLRNAWDNIRYIDMPIIGVLEREEREKGADNLLEEMRKYS